MISSWTKHTILITVHTSKGEILYEDEPKDFDAAHQSLEDARLTAEEFDKKPEVKEPLSHQKTWAELDAEEDAPLLETTLHKTVVDALAQ